MSAPAPPYAVVHVVVPAHDEQDLLPACLRSLRAATSQLRRHRPEVLTRVTVVADRCSDATAALTRAAGIDLVELDAGCVGRARQAGVRRATELAGPVAADRVWVANTDADTVVPRDWLLRQLALADTGHRMVVGTVRPDHLDLDPAVLRAWHRVHSLGEGHPYVHGANLGVSLAALHRVGGFAPVAVGEDVLLVRAVQRAGLPWCATATTEVTTSARRRSRVSGGFAGFLRDLHATDVTRPAPATGPEAVCGAPGRVEEERPRAV
ncbi:glycosyltransferase [Nocardioides panaciterrulae]|uniref:4,4'-diaponeurosporenoate glycosyltransferase n=1 Tax=Nocardioides panaciterrulae TaxID=661492 RepID=A0A7Y9JBS4_9ACTN|nr:glycosyltransferase involved in cell wall biosynthesis [Nocardioides panaciterrulae]